MHQVLTCTAHGVVREPSHAAESLYARGDFAAKLNLEVVHEGCRQEEKVVPGVEPAADGETRG